MSWRTNKKGQHYQIRPRKGNGSVRMSQKGSSFESVHKKYKSETVEVYRGFDDAGSRNAETALKRGKIDYTVTHSAEGRNDQFKMVEFHVAPKDEQRASEIIEEHTNTDTRETKYYM